MYSIRSGIVSQWSFLMWGFSDSTGESILNSLEAAYIVYVQEKIVAADYFSFEIEHIGRILRRSRISGYA